MTDDTQADTGNWSPTYDIGLGKHLDTQADTDSTMTLGELIEMPEDTGMKHSRRLMVRIGGKLEPVRDVSIMPRRSWIVLETEL